MQVDIYITEREGSREVRIPWLPEKIKFTSGGTTFAEYDILDRGAVAVPTGSGLAGVGWESEFPGKNRTDDSMFRGTPKEPKYYHNIFEEWKRNGTPLRVMVTGYPINMDCFIKDYEGEASGGFGDWIYTIAFLETREIELSTGSTKDSTGQNSTKRSTTTSKTYTVKPGDCLWSIAEKEMGGGSKWKTLYEANKTIIEKTAKDHGYSSSNNGWWIFAGTVLALPL